MTPLSPARRPDADPRRPGVILVLGPWSCGSTAVAGYLARLGGWTCPPHQMTNDPRTPDSHESLAFRDALCATFDEFTLQQRRPLSDLSLFLDPWLSQQRDRAGALGRPAVVLKHPLAAFALDSMLGCCPDLRILVVTRPLDAIEASRLRRRWHPVYGRDGARQIYGAIFTGLIGSGRGFEAVSYPEFLSDPAGRADLALRLALSVGPEDRARAEAWLRVPSPAPASA